MIRNDYECGVYQIIVFSPTQLRTLRCALLSAESRYFVYFANGLEDRSEANACAALLERICCDPQLRKHTVHTT